MHYDSSLKKTKMCYCRLIEFIESQYAQAEKRRRLFPSNQSRKSSARDNITNGDAVVIDLDKADVPRKKARVEKSIDAAAQMPKDLALTDQFDSKVRPFIDLVDDLRQYGLEQDINLPAIVVIGDQSSGKSSILEAISGVQLPRGSGIVTRCPLEMKLKRSVKDTQLKWSSRLQYTTAEGIKKDIDVESPSNIENLIRFAQNEIAGNKSGISENLISLSVTSSECPDLTLIDLPGIARTAVAGQPSNICEKIKDLLRGFIENPQTIILCVIPANVDIAVNEALSLANNYDENGIRTLGVLTKPDLVDRGTENDVLAILSNEKYHLKKGYSIVRCRGQQEITDGSTLNDAMIEESKFFAKHRHYQSVPDYQKGIQQLAIKLTDNLVEHIQRILPNLYHDVEEKLKKASEILTQLGCGIPDQDSGKRYYLMKVITNVIETMEKLIIKGDVVPVSVIKSSKGHELPELKNISQNATVNAAWGWRHRFDRLRKRIDYQTSKMSQYHAYGTQSVLEAAAAEILDSDGLNTDFCEASNDIAVKTAKVSESTDTIDPFPQDENRIKAENVFFVSPQPSPSSSVDENVKKESHKTVFLENNIIKRKRKEDIPISNALNPPKHEPWNKVILFQSPKRQISVDLDASPPKHDDIQPLLKEQKSSVGSVSNPFSNSLKSIPSNHGTPIRAERCPSQVGRVNRPVDDVIVLSSDDEDSTQTRAEPSRHFTENIIVLSSDEEVTDSAHSAENVAGKRLRSTCSRCGRAFQQKGLRRHIKHGCPSRRREAAGSQDEISRGAFKVSNLTNSLDIYRGRELEPFLNFELFESLVREHIKKYKPVLTECLEDVNKDTYALVLHACKEHLQFLPKVLDKVKFLAEETRVESLDRGYELMELEIQKEQLVYVQDQTFSTEITKRMQTTRTTNKKTVDPSEVQEIVQDYMTVANRRISDSVPMLIRATQHHQYFKLLKDRLQCMVGEDGIEEIVKEDYKLESKRKSMEARRQRLTSAMRRLAQSQEIGIDISSLRYDGLIPKVHI